MRIPVEGNDKKRKAPPQIWLQFFDAFGDPVDEVTWADEPIEPSDVRYIRSDLAIFYEGEDDRNKDT